MEFKNKRTSEVIESIPFRGAFLWSIIGNIRHLPTTKLFLKTLKVTLIFYPIITDAQTMS